MKTKCFVALMLLLVPAIAQSEELLLNRSVFISSGGLSAQDTYKFQYTSGEQIAGQVSTDSSIACFGFWGKRNIIVGIDGKEDGQINYVTSLDQNFPNPFNPQTTINYSVGSGNPISIVINIYDVTGALVKTLVNETKTTGQYSVMF